MSDQRDVQPGPHGAFGTSPSTESRPPVRGGEGGYQTPSSPPSIDRCVKIWGLAHRGVWFYPEAMREVQYVEQGLPPCDHRGCPRSGTVNHGAYRLCGEHTNRPNGDDIDREWERYKEATDA